MIIKNQDAIAYEDTSDLQGVKKKILLGPRDESNEVVMRYFSLDPGGATPYHTHDFPHLVKVEKGEGYVIDAMGNEHLLQLGQLVYIPDKESHGFKNFGTEPFDFICVIPGRGEK